MLLIQNFLEIFRMLRILFFFLHAKGKYRTYIVDEGLREVCKIIKPLKSDSVYPVSARILETSIDYVRES